MHDPAWFAPPESPRWLGLDVGGANLKAADGRGWSRSLPFELWKRPTELAGAITAVIAHQPGPPAAGFALTMTGELADCYATKAEGVRAIVAAVEEAAAGKPVRVATTDDRWLAPITAREHPERVAAANWRVAARLVARASRSQAGVWIDVGSTTTDIIPFHEGHVTSRGQTDTERLLAGELIYTGAGRTPVCAIVEALPYRGRLCPVVAEWFATSADAWLVLGEIEEDPTDQDTADGRPRTLDASVDRLARCLGADATTFNQDDARAAATAIADRQLDLIARSMPNLAGRCWLTGSGAFLSRRALDSLGREWHSLAAEIGEGPSRSFPAHAAAMLAAIEIGAVE